MASQYDLSSWFDPYCQLFGFWNCRFIPSEQVTVFWAASVLVAVGFGAIVIDWTLHKVRRVRLARAARARKRMTAPGETMSAYRIRRLTTTAVD